MKTMILSSLIDEHINKCRQCLYLVMTAEELAQLGSDPCDSCTDLRNWRKKTDIRR